jgi:hypothetical protein
MAYEESRVEAKELLVAKKVSPQAPEGESRYGKNGYSVRVVQWLFEGKGKNKGTVQGSVSLEKREFYLNEDGDLRTGKAKGFTLEDLAVIKDNWAKITSTMLNAPAPEWPTGGSKPKPAPIAVPDDLEDVPF